MTSGAQSATHRATHPDDARPSRSPRPSDAHDEQSLDGAVTPANSTRIGVSASQGYVSAVPRLPDVSQRVVRTSARTPDSVAPSQQRVARRSDVVVQRYWMVGATPEDRFEADFSPPIEDLDFRDLTVLMNQIKAGRVELTDREKLAIVERIDVLEGRTEPREAPTLPPRERSPLQQAFTAPVEVMSYAELEEVKRRIIHDGLTVTRPEAVRLATRAKRLQKITDLDEYRNDALVQTEFVTPDHKRAIAIYCQKNNVILSVRDTGSHSLLRVAEGAKPKPHTILEKSIKVSSLNAGGHAAAAEALRTGADEVPDIEGVSVNDLKGFVGHWHPDDRRLLGVRVDKQDVLSGTSSARPGDEDHFSGLQILRPFLAGVDGDSPYIPLDRFAAFREALPDNRWKQYLYTGDYDLHEVYKAKKTLMEASQEKARLLTGVNNAIAQDQSRQEQRGGDRLPPRTGAITVHHATQTIGGRDARGTRPASPGREVAADTLHAEPGSQYAMIQHGDQMGYITNQIHEGRLTDESKKLKAQLVPPVAQESPGPLAWCVNGDWYVTENADQHAEFRSRLKIRASSGWSRSFQDRIRDGQLRTLEHISADPTELGTRA